MQVVLMVSQTFYSVGDNFILLAVPMFLMMSNILLKAGIGDDLFGFAQAWVGNFPGGLAVATILSCSIFAAISGSSVATAATISTVAYPAMIKRGYHKNFCLGILAAGGTLGILIPPSIPMIVYAFVVEESVLSMFLAGIGPGILLAFLFIIFSVFLGKEVPIENIASKSITEIVPSKYLYSDTDQQQTLRNKRYLDFVRLMYRFAKYKEHPFPEAVAAQASYESRYGASEIARNANNIFGIKARKNTKGVNGSNVYRAITKEETRDGREEYLYQNFEAFENLEENWMGYMRVISRDRYIRNGLREAKTNKEYITALKKGGYATEDDYINHLDLIIKRYKDLGLFY